MKSQPRDAQRGFFRRRGFESRSRVAAPSKRWVAFSVEVELWKDHRDVSCHIGFKTLMK